MVTDYGHIVTQFRDYVKHRIVPGDFKRMNTLEVEAEKHGLLHTSPVER